MNPRVAAARLITQVVREHQTLFALLDDVASAAAMQVAATDVGLVRELCYGVLRWYPRLDALAARLLTRPLKAKDAVLQALIMVGLYQLLYTRIPAHAAVAETVAGASAMGRPWAKGMVNAVLRRCDRERAALLAALDADPVARWAHPRWLLTRLQQAWPADWQALADASNTRPPMALRVNAARMSRARYLERLAAHGIAAEPIAHTSHGVVLAQPCGVEALPGFDSGDVSVQDGAAQLAAPLLELAGAGRVLDACAAPGGKTGHILEQLAAAGRPGTDVTALDLSEQRLARVGATLQRLDLHARLVAGDAARPAGWWDGQPYHRILVDAPCSATGVIRRHPDIKVLRTEAEVRTACMRQADILDALWPLLAPGGRLVYATCSVLPEENAAQVDRFLGVRPDAAADPPAVDWGRRAGAGRQILPGEDGMDGFFYAVLRKR